MYLYVCNVNLTKEWLCRSEMIWEMEKKEEKRAPAKMEIYSLLKDWRMEVWLEMWSNGILEWWLIDSLMDEPDSGIYAI